MVTDVWSRVEVRVFSLLSVLYFIHEFFFFLHTLHLFPFFHRSYSRCSTFSLSLPASSTASSCRLHNFMRSARLFRCFLSLFFFIFCLPPPFFLFVCVCFRTQALIYVLFTCPPFFFSFLLPHFCSASFFFLILHLASFAAKRSFSYAEVRTQDRSREKKSSHSHYQSL